MSAEKTQFLTSSQNKFIYRIARKLIGHDSFKVCNVSNRWEVFSPGEGGGVLYFFLIRRLGPSIYRSPQKNIRNFKHPKFFFEILATQKISQFCTLTLKKTLKCKEMTLKLAKFCDDPKKISTKSSYPQRIFIFLKTPQKIEIQNFEPPPPKKKKKKKARAYVCAKISESPHGYLVAHVLKTSTFSN